MRIITLSGRIASDAIKQTTRKGKEYIYFRMGNNEFGDAKDEQGRPITYWFAVTCFSGEYMNMQPYLTKGKPITVVGRYSDMVYQNRNTGNCEIGRNIRAEMIYFQETNNKTTDGNGSQMTESSQTNTVKQNNAVEMPKTQTQMVKPEHNDMVGRTNTNASFANNDSDDDLPF